MPHNAEAVFTIITPCFNKWELTKNCLESLATKKCSIPYNLIFIDNASSDATATDLKPLGEKLFGERFFGINLSENKNFAGACNLGASLAKTKYLLFLNNDTLVTDYWAEPLIEELENNSDEICAVGPLLLYEDDTVQHLGVVFGFCYVTHLYSNYKRTHPVVHKKRKFKCITGAVFLIEKQLFLEYEGFFEGFKNGFEDVDLCLRITQGTGKRMSVVPESVIYHLESQSPGRKDNERANATLIHERCSELMIPDVHIYTKADGYEVKISDTLEIAFFVSKEKSEKMMVSVTGKKLTELVALCQKELHWYDGILALAKALEEKGEVVLALQAYSNVLKCCGSRDVYQRCLKLIEKNPEGRDSIVNSEWLFKMVEFFADTARYKLVLEGMTARVAATHDKELITLIRRKIIESQKFFDNSN